MSFTLPFNIKAEIKDYFTITVGGHYLKDSNPYIAFGDYELVESVSEISDNNLFEDYNKASERLDAIYNTHRLLRVSTTPENKLKIVPVRRVEYIDTEARYKTPMPCPICGSMPLLSSKDMGRPGGHGYPGCTAYTLNCNCGHMHGSSADTVYSKNSEEAKAKAVKAWNKEVEEVEQLLKHRG